MIWTWADGHPYDPYSELSQPTQFWMLLQDVLSSAFGVADEKVSPCMQGRAHHHLHISGFKTALQGGLDILRAGADHCKHIA